MLSNSSHKKGFDLLQPAPAWAAIIGLALFTVLCLLVRAGGIFRPAFLVGSFAVGVFLYRRYPILYIGFTWWLWFLTPFLSRMADFVSGLGARQLLIVTPYLVTALTINTFLRQLPRAYKLGGLPFILASLGVFYSFFVGLSHHLSPDAALLSANIDPTFFPYTPMKIAEALLSWLTAICFGFHLFVNWREYPQLKQNIQRNFCWGVFVMGVYGIVQYIVAPPWERFWFENSPDVQYCCGWPEPFMIRVWSTLNYTFTFAYFMMPALLLLLGSKGPMRVPATVAGYLSFLLATVRSAWGGWFVGFVLFFTSLKARFQMRLLIAILALGLCILPLVSVEPFSNVIASRFQTFSNIRQDESLDERNRIYSEQVNQIIADPFGKGMGGGKVVDAGLLDILNTLGWFGVLPYASGVILLLFNLFQYAEVRIDPFINASRSVVVSLLMVLPAANTFVILPGVVFWGFAGIAMAGHKYYQYQRSIGVTKN